jgi:hypothetical protein
MKIIQNRKKKSEKFDEHSTKSQNQKKIIAHSKKLDRTPKIIKMTKFGGN